MHLNFARSLGIFLSTISIVVVLSAFAGIVASFFTPEFPGRPAGLSALEAAEDRARIELLENIRPSGIGQEVEKVPPVNPDAPEPAGTRMYNNLLDNLLSSLHFYYPIENEDDPTRLVISWDADTGDRVLTNSLLVALEFNIKYLLALETYRVLHTKAVFDSDLEYVRNKVDQLFLEDWHTVIEWPLAPYFDLINLYEVTGNEKYLQYAERYAAGEGPEDPDTPLNRARGYAFQHQFNRARSANPFHLFHAALLADWGKRNNTALLDSARTLFDGIEDMLYDSRYNLFWKQASTQSDGQTTYNVIQTFDTLEQLSAVKALILYARASSDPEVLSLAKTVIRSIWSQSSPLVMPPPEGVPESTFMGLYTAYDHERMAARYDKGEITIDQVLLLDANVMMNEVTRGEFRGDVDFLKAWLEDAGPLYRKEINGYYVTYDEEWKAPERRLVSANAAIAMAYTLAADEFYKYRMTQAITSGEPE